MPRQNPFLRRASSPGDINTEINHGNNNNLLSVPPPPLPQQHPAKLTQASLSDSALKVPVRPSTFRNTQSRMMSIRPSRFIKASTPTLSTSSPIILNDTSVHCSSQSTEMTSFIRLFDTFTQKLYIEGYVMRHNKNTTMDDGSKPRTKMFMELSGSTLTLWDTEVPGSTVMPTYFQIVDTTIVYSNPIISADSKKKKHVFSVQNKKTTMTFETSDEPSMIRWVSAIRLSCFEKQKLHQLFTLRLLDDIPTKSTWLQVRVPGTSIWQKYWVVLRFGKKASVDNVEEHILLYETKKSKSPLWTLSRLTHAYAVYPESPQLIEKGSMIRIECKLNGGGVQQRASESLDSNDNICCCWFMADHSQLTIQWLLTVYDTFSLYGRPEQLLADPTNQRALNFGEPLQDVGTVVHPKLFLETDEVVHAMNVLSIPRQEIDAIFTNAILKKQAETSIVTVTRRPTGTRANSLPLITVISATGDDDKVKSALEETTVKSADAEDQAAPFKFARQVADSSDESDDEEEDDDGEEDDEDVDSDDEPIGKKSAHSPPSSATPEEPEESTAKKVFADSLIPDFDFGNGFDVPKNVTAAAVAAAVNASSLSQTLPTRGKNKGARHSNSMTMFMDSSSSISPLDSSSRQDGDPPASSSSALFGDFSLTTDFRKFLDEPLDQRKYSLPANVKLSSMESSRSTSSSNNNNLHRWGEQEWEDATDNYADNEDYDDEEQPSQHPYDDDNQSYDSDFDGPLIPSLGDHFAPQNSLLDTYLGEQLSAKEQIEYAKATGQPLIQVSTKKQGAPRGGLVGMISQREKDRKEGNGLRVTERVNQHHAQLGQDRFEREKERRIFEQRQHQFLKHQMMLYANGYGMPPLPMMHPHSFMSPMSPMGPMSPMPMSPMGPIAPPSPHTPSYGNHIRPIYGPPPPSSPMGFYQQQQQQHYQQGRQSPSLSAPLITHNNRRVSRPLLDDVEELNGSGGGSSSRTMSPVLRKSPIVSTSSGTSSVRM
ncbi:hypothetical protein V8B55DRAFT_1571742 [Mucor lusitanicus]|uniref:PH domain-containing protein n=1 Tax=Mucor circinelloides f. lusitanicus TaxID=29924 RepID=A0A8H4F2S3_MUCCL|nr:hypothetical protein FB192DRAFT_1325253 [Mucor lusitanicus]